jgi:transposase-like protein
MPHRLFSLNMVQEADFSHDRWYGDMSGKGKRLTPEIRIQLREAKSSVRNAARKFGVSPTTVQKWRGRPSETHLLSKERPRSRISAAQAVRLIELRRDKHKLRSIIDAMKDEMPGLSMSSLHRLLAGAGLTSPRTKRRLLDDEDAKDECNDGFDSFPNKRIRGGSDW